MKASSVWIAGVLQSTTDRERMAQLASNRRLSRAAAVRRWDVKWMQQIKSTLDDYGAQVG
jgi:hypothetical protein